MICSFNAHWYENIKQNILCMFSKIHWFFAWYSDFKNLCTVATEGSRLRDSANAFWFVVAQNCVITSWQWKVLWFYVTNCVYYTASRKIWLLLVEVTSNMGDLFRIIPYKMSYKMSYQSGLIYKLLFNDSLVGPAWHQRVKAESTVVYQFSWQWPLQGHIIGLTSIWIINILW